jgi:plastocyanin
MRRPLALAACLTAALSGCGGGGEKRAPRTETVPRGQVVRVAGREYSFDPGAVVVTAGRVRIRFSNEGSLAHDLRVFRGGRDLGGVKPFQGGARSAELRLEPGSYRMVCTVGDHATLGMSASLRVRARN